MNLYEHTIILRQDLSEKEVEKIKQKYIKLIEENNGNVIKIENWGIMNLSYVIKKNKKGNYLHFKFKSEPKNIFELEKNEKIDKNILRFLTVKVKKFDLEKSYFENSETKKKKCSLSFLVFARDALPRFSSWATVY